MDPLAPPLRIAGRYVLYDAIAAGGMATVHYGRLVGPAGFSRIVAIKRLHPQFARDAEFVSMFLDEARLAARIQHGNVVTTLEVVAEDGELFLILEYVPGESLARLIRAVRADHQLLPPRVAVAIAAGILRGLSAAHDATSEQGEPLGIVHRDVSPQNILVGTDGQARVLDFGVAKAVGRLQTTQDGKLKGKLGYMAPEQLRGQVVDRRTDVFAASVVLWESLTARRLFQGDNEGAVVSQILDGATPAPSSVLGPEDAPADSLATIRALDDVVLAGLARDASLRFASCRDMALALEAVVAPAGVSEVSEWVARVARDVLLERARHVADIESGSGPPSSGLRTIRALAGGSDEATLVERPARSRLRRATWAVLGVPLVAAAAVGATRLGPGGVATGERSARSSAGAPSAADARAPLPSGPPDMVLVFGFDNRTSDVTLDGTVDVVFAGALKRSPVLFAVAGTTLRSIVAEEASEATGQDELAARLIARREQKSVAVVHGSVSPQGPGFSVAFTADDGASGTRLTEGTGYAPDIGSVVRTTADLACALRASLHDAPCDEASRGKTGLSDSIEADHELVIGRGAFNRGDNFDAEPHFARAIELDPDFAMAQLSLGLLLSNTNRASAGLPHLAAALARQEQLSERERLVLAASDHVMRDELDEAAATYQSQLDRWPIDRSPGGNLTTSLFTAGRVGDATAAAQRTLRNSPRNASVWGTLAALDVVSGELEEAARDAHMVVANFSRPASIVVAAGAAADRLLGRRNAALDLHGTLDAADPARAALAADLAMFEGRLDDARATLERALAAEDARKTVGVGAWLATLAEVRLRRGEPGPARSAAGRAASSDDLVTLVRAGRALAQAGDPSGAEAVARRIKAHPGQRAPALARLVQAEAQLARHAPREALAALGEVGSGPGSALAHVLRGEAELDLGETADASRELEWVLAHPGALAFAFFDETSTLRYLPPVAFAAARAKELLHTPDAADAYRAFLAMEPDAQGDPLVEVARRRVTR